MKQKPIALVLEDNPDFQTEIYLILEELGFVPIVTANPDHFLKKATMNKPDLVLVNLNINSICIGYKIIETFREKISVKTPILVLSDTNDPSSIGFSIEAGATDFLIKTGDKSYFGLKISQYIKTDALLEYTRKFQTVIEEKGQAELALFIEIDAIDEMGIYFACPHQMMINSTIRLSRNFFKELTGEKNQVLLTIAMVTPDQNGSIYNVYAKFDPENEELITAIRNWLSSKI